MESARSQRATADPVAGFRAGLDWIVNDVGIDWAYARVKELGERCYAGLAGIDGVRMVTPREQMAGLICFQIDGLSPQDLTKALLESGITIRYVDQAPSPQVARVSCGWWLTEDEIDRFVAEVGRIAAEARA